MTSPLTPAQVAELRELERGATPGPWQWDANAEGTEEQPTLSFTHSDPDLGQVAIWLGDPFWNTSDGYLIAATRNAMPALLEAAEEVNFLRDTWAKAAHEADLLRAENARLLGLLGRALPVVEQARERAHPDGLTTCGALARDIRQALSETGRGGG